MLFHDEEDDGAKEGRRKKEEEGSSKEEQGWETPCLPGESPLLEDDHFPLCRALET